MSLINRHESCWGLTLYSFNCFNKRAEIWYCPRGYVIKEHCHPKENVELMFLFGRTIFYRRNIYSGIEESLATTWKCIFKCFSVMHFHSHWFEVSAAWPLIFVNFQTFKYGSKLESAAKDFLLTKKD